MFDTNLLVSAFLSRNNPGAVSSELLHLAREGRVQLYLPPDIIAETLETLLRSKRARDRYRYTTRMAAQFCENLLSAAMIVVDPPPIPGAVPRDPDDDMIVACAVAASASYLVTRDQDLLSVGDYRGVAIVMPEEIIHIIRAEPG